MHKKDRTQNKIIGKRIRSVRMMNNLTQENLGDMLGISAQAIQKIESGENSVTVSSLLIICERLNTTPDFILLGKNNSARDFEMAFETLEGDEKLRLLFRLLLYVNDVENEKYKQLLIEMIEMLDKNSEF